MNYTEFTSTDGCKQYRCKISFEQTTKSVNVHNEFKAFVILDTTELKQHDPPFLNRFEKHLIRTSEIMAHDHPEIISNLVERLSIFSNGPIKKTFPLFQST